MGQRLDRAGVRMGADMKIEAGKYYRTRGGQVFGPMVREAADHMNYPWGLVSSEPENSWTGNGRWSTSGREHPFDLVSEVYVSDTPPEAAPAPEAKTLRDEFAMEAMKLLLPKNDWQEGILALYSYKQADAMMEAREK